MIYQYLQLLKDTLKGIGNPVTHYLDSPSVDALSISNMSTACLLTFKKKVSVVHLQMSNKLSVGLSAAFQHNGFSILVASQQYISSFSTR